MDQVLLSDLWYGESMLNRWWSGCAIELCLIDATLSGAWFTGSGLILGLRLANERQRYFVTTSLIGWVHALNKPCWFARSLQILGVGHHIVP